MRKLPLTLFLSFFVTMGLSPAWALDGTIHEVMSVEGRAVLILEDASETPLSEAQLIQAGDQIRVDSNSELKIVFDSDWNNVVQVDENSSISVVSLNPTIINLSEGEVEVKLDSVSKGQTFAIRTPTAVAGVRGTAFGVKYRRGKSEFFGYRGSVNVTALDEKGHPLGKSMLLSKNMSAHVNKQRKIAKIKQLTEKRRARGEQFIQKTQIQRKALIKRGRKPLPPQARPAQRGVERPGTVRDLKKKSRKLKVSSPNSQNNGPQTRKSKAKEKSKPKPKSRPGPRASQ